MHTVKYEYQKIRDNVSCKTLMPDSPFLIVLAYLDLIFFFAFLFFILNKNNDLSLNKITQRFLDQSQIMGYL